jgi:hypothetical protein
MHGSTSMLPKNIRTCNFFLSCLLLENFGYIGLWMIVTSATLPIWGKKKKKKKGVFFGYNIHTSSGQFCCKFYDLKKIK